MLGAGTPNLTDSEESARCKRLRHVHWADGQEPGN